MKNAPIALSLPLQLNGKEFSPRVIMDRSAALRTMLLAQ